jgi:hypothetical protein
MNSIAQQLVMSPSCFAAIIKNNAFKRVSCVTVKLIAKISVMKRNVSVQETNLSAVGNFQNAFSMTGFGELQLLIFFLNI